MNIRTICLAILYRGDATGYEIRKASTEGQFCHFVEASYGSIYPALAKLEQEGNVTVREESQPGKPARKIYSLTDAGRQAFADALSTPPSPDTFRSEFLLVAMFAEIADPEKLKTVIDERIAHVKGELAHMKDVLANCDHPGSRWTINYGISVYSASLDYLEKNREELQIIAAEKLGKPAVAAE